MIAAAMNRAFLIFISGKIVLPPGIDRHSAKLATHYGVKSMRLSSLVAETGDGGCLPGFAVNPPHGMIERAEPDRFAGVMGLLKVISQDWNSQRYPEMIIRPIDCAASSIRLEASVLPPRGWRLVADFLI